LPGRLVKLPAPPLAAAPAIEPLAGIYGALQRVPHALIPADRNTLLPKALLEGENRAP
jgi:hypothetical protein